tara:strand:- start:22 stop:168 length:147 start_codon:yes stop_codon:yes gene_type:complete
MARTGSLELNTIFRIDGGRGHVIRMWVVRGGHQILLNLLYLAPIYQKD